MVRELNGRPKDWAFERQSGVSAYAISQHRYLCSAQTNLC